MREQTTRWQQRHHPAFLVRCPRRKKEEEERGATCAFINAVFTAAGVSANSNTQSHKLRAEFRRKPRLPTPTRLVFIKLLFTFAGDTFPLSSQQNKVKADSGLCLKQCFQELRVSAVWCFYLVWEDAAGQCDWLSAAVGKLEQPVEWPLRRPQGKLCLCLCLCLCPAADVYCLLCIWNCPPVSHSRLLFSQVFSAMIFIQVGINVSTSFYFSTLPSEANIVLLKVPYNVLILYGLKVPCYSLFQIFLFHPRL